MYIDRTPVLIAYRAGACMDLSSLRRDDVVGDLIGDERYVPVRQAVLAAKLPVLELFPAE